MSVLPAILIILAMATAAGGIMAGLAILVRRQKERLAAPLMISLCPECGVRFGLTVVERIDAIDISLSATDDGHGVNEVIKSTVVCFDCPHCRTGWKYCEGALVKASAMEVPYGPMPFSWLVPLFKERPSCHLAWQIKRTAIVFCRGNREEMLSFLRQREFTLYLSWLFGLALWSVIFPSFQPFYCHASYGRRVEFGFVFMVLGLVTGIIAWFRCPEKRYAGLAIGINTLPIAWCVGFLGLILEARAWNIQMNEDLLTYRFD